MTADKKIFFSISLLSIYIFLKEKYKNNSIDDIQKDIDLETVGKMLSKLEKYQHLPNKHNIVQNAYNEFSNCKVDSKIDENKLFDIVSTSIEELSEDEKKYILNSIVFVANSDKKITNEEKELILQVNYLLGFKNDFNRILKDFNKSEFSAPISTPKLVMLLVIILTVVLGTCFYFYKEQSNKINIFKNDRVVFSDMSFNRYVIYKNSYQISEYFLKQAVFYFDGVAEIGFDPKNIKYNPVTKEITLFYKEKPFIVNTSYNNVLLVDKIDSKPIFEDDAKKIAGGFAIVGGYVGAQAGSVLGSFVGTVKPELKVIAPILGASTGAVLGGVGVYFTAKNILEGAKLTDDISKEEEEKVKLESKKLIDYVLYTDTQLFDLYKNSFDSFIKNKYASVGIEVIAIKYEEVK